VQVAGFHVRLTFTRTSRNPPGPVMTDDGVALSLVCGAGCVEPVGEGDADDVGAGPVGAAVAVGAAVGAVVGLRPPPEDGDVVPLGEVVAPGELVAAGGDGVAVGEGVLPGFWVAWYVNALCSVVGVLPNVAYTATSYVPGCIGGAKNVADVDVLPGTTLAGTPPTKMLMFVGSALPVRTSIPPEVGSVVGARPVIWNWSLPGYCGVPPLPGAVVGAGPDVGCAVGRVVGCAVGCDVGCAPGWVVGCVVGCAVG
jgi:hypothetical protein